MAARAVAGRGHRGPGDIWRLDEALHAELGRRVLIELHHEWRWGWTP